MVTRIAAPWRALTATALVVSASAAAAFAAGAQVDASLYGGLVWRSIGPFRGGRISAVGGPIGQPGVYYAGTPAGGVWKTTSAGETWFPVFDSVRSVSSIGALAVSPSDPNVIYVGTGEFPTGGNINEGDGAYKSTDAGRSWQHLGLEATTQIPSILVDPRDANVVLLAAQGNPHVKSGERGVYRSSDGGRSWTKTLYVDDEIGGQKLAAAYDVPDVIYATTVHHYTAPNVPPRRGPPAQPDTGRTGTAVYKSTDEGRSWHELTGGGLPRLNGRTSIAVANNTNAQRVFLISNAGLYRSDDGGATWRQMDSTDHRIRNGQGGYNCGVYVDPQNPDIVYTLNTSSYKSVDGGNTFTGFKGAPGGDDPQQMWIDPTNGRRMEFGYDQGAIVSLDGGATWSSWYNQDTEQVYHLSTDTSFPYWVYGTQQDAGAVATRSRGNLGEVGPLDWKPVPGWEWGTIIADPNDANTVYASGSGISRITYPTEEWINVSPAADPNLKLETSFSQPILFAPWNSHELLAGFQYLMATTDGGVHWKKLSPDLGVAKGQPTQAADGGPPGRRRGGQIESISASTAAAGTIWVGTNNGKIQVTTDHGATWRDVSIPDLPNAEREDVVAIDASHRNAATAYVAIEGHNNGDYTPYLYRTRDLGKTWTRIVNGLPVDQASGSFAHVIRADTKRAGLLFAGTASAMYVSFDDGDHWQSLQLGLPNTSCRDLTIHGNDVVLATFGRGIWVLDDISPLRQLTPAIAREPAHLFKPGDAVRARRNVNYDTPFPVEVPHALNPPDGALIYYSLASRPAGDITLDVTDSSGARVHHASSVAPPPVPEAARPPESNFWVAPPEALPTNAGTNRATWNLRYDPPPAFVHTFEINANPGQTPPSPEGPMVIPGVYTVKLTAGGATYTEHVRVTMDPRSRATAADLRAEHALQMGLYNGIRVSFEGYERVAALRAQVASLASGNAPTEVRSAAAALDSTLGAVGGDTAGGGFGGGGGRGGAPPKPTFARLNATFVAQLEAMDNGDMAPNEPTRRGYLKSCADLASVEKAWQSAASLQLAALNAALAKAGMTAVSARPPGTSLGCSTP